MIIKARDKDIKVPDTSATLFDIKNDYLMYGILPAERTEQLLTLTDYVIDRLISTESERFRENY